MTRNQTRLIERHVIRLVFACVLGLNLAGAGVLHAQNLPTGHEWLRIAIGNFEVITDLDQSHAIQLARSADRMIAAVARATMLDTSFDRPIRILAFHDSATFRPYRDAIMGPGTDKHGLFTRQPYGDYVLLDASRPHIETLLFHELTHEFMSNSYPHAPLWLNEGFAEFFGTLQIRDNEIRLGLPDRDAIKLLRRELLPVEELLVMEGDAEEYRRGHTASVFYAESWALVHYLLIQQKADIGPYLQRRMFGETPVTAFERSFALSAAEVQHELFAYVRRPTLNIRVIPIERLDTSEPVVDVLSEAEILEALGILLTDARHSDHAIARQFLEEALRRNGQLSGALAALGDLESEAGNGEAAEQRYRAAREIDPKEPRAAVEPGMVRDTRIEIANPGTERRTSEMRADIKEALEDVHRQAVEDLSNATTEEERERLRKLIEYSSPPETTRPVSALYQEAIRLANDQKIDEALALIDEILARSPEGTLFYEAARDLRDQIDRQR